MAVISVRLADGREADVLRVGHSGGRPVLFFHSPASAGEELGDAADRAAHELGIEVFSMVRRSLADEGAGERFMAAVASDTQRVLGALSLGPVVALGWSGGGPYALAAADRLGLAVPEVHLVSPLPGPLTGPDALAHQSARLRQIVGTSPTSNWVVAPGTLRDYMALVAPWPFEVTSVRQPVTIWAPTDDEVVPPGLLEGLASRLPHSKTMRIPGSHDWFTMHWSTVLGQIVAP